jgi:hypothetical protein
LKSLPRLRTIGVARTRVTERGLDELRSALPGLEVW